MQQPQAPDLKWLPTEGWLWCCYIIQTCGIDSCLLLPALTLPENMFLKVPINVISLSSSKPVLEHSVTLPSRVGSIELLPPAWCRAPSGPCLRSGVTQGAFQMAMTAQGLRSGARMLEVEGSLGGQSVRWGNLLSLVATFGQAEHVLTALRAVSSLMERGKRKGARKIPSSSLWLGWHSICAFSPVCLGELFSLPLKRASAAEPRNPQADVHTAWEK